MKILAINPGGLSTKIGVYENQKPLWTEDIQHSANELKQFVSVLDQFDFRAGLIQGTLAEKGLPAAELSACVGRGGLFKPLRAGTYRVGEGLLEDIRNGSTIADHPSNLGALLADFISRQAGSPAFIVDPVSVDEFDPEARYTGLPQMERRSLVHALNIRATAFKEAGALGRKLNDLNFVVAHLGSGFSICPIRHGRIFDVNNANDGGPFSPQRAGTLPITQLVDLAYSGEYPTAKALNTVLTKKSGLTAHLATHDMREVERLIAVGDANAMLVFRAMSYQIVKEIGAMAAALDGAVDAILVTGGLAYSARLTRELTRRLSWIAPVKFYPGENELEALAMGARRVLLGEESALEYI